MKNELIFLPVVAQVLLTLWLYIRLLGEKKKSVAAGTVNEERRSLHDDAWPDHVAQVNNNINNQYEAPVLFYVLIFTLFSLNAINIYIHVIAWLFVLSRVIHSNIHIGNNHVPTRRKVFMAGSFMLVGLSVYTAGFIINSAFTG